MDSHRYLALSIGKRQLLTKMSLQGTTLRSLGPQGGRLRVRPQDRNLSAHLTAIKTKPTTYLPYQRKAYRGLCFLWHSTANPFLRRRLEDGGYQRQRGARVWAFVLWDRSDDSKTLSVCSNLREDTRSFTDFRVAAQYIQPKPGYIVDAVTHRILGTHQGLWGYTIGQNARIPGLREKMFVSEKDASENVIFVVPGS